METGTYIARRGQLETYFDRTAVEAWAKLTTDAPVSKIRATVRAGRDQIRNALLSWLPEDLTGVSILDAGCGTGALSIEAARRGAMVTAIDLSPTLVELARERAPTDLAGTVTWLSGDMLSPDLGSFDHVIGMDSMIHYKAADMAAMLVGLTKRTRKSILFTHAPRTPMLTVMHAVGRLFPQGNRAPFIEPIANSKIRQLFLAHPESQGWSAGRDLRVTTGFYMSHAQELVVR